MTEDRIARAREAGEFLVDRLDEFEAALEDGISFREYHGHVSPALARFRSALAALASLPDDVSEERSVADDDLRSRAVAELNRRLEYTNGLDCGQRFTDTSIALDAMVALAKAERERCAKIAEEYPEWPPDGPEIAAAIRKATA